MNLSEAYELQHARETVRAALCPACNTIYIDDDPRWGSLISPCHPDWALVRGVYKDIEAMAKIPEKMRIWE